jgi:hypothetical protein
VREGSVFYCSEGGMDNEDCQIMTGYAVRYLQLLRDTQKFSNKYLHSSTLDSHYIAYLQDNKGEITKRNLTKNYGESVKIFNSLVKPKNSVYTAGVVGHTKTYNWWQFHTSRIGNERNFDIYIMLVKYAQKEFDLFKSLEVTEKGAMVKTRNFIQQKWNKDLEELKANYKGKGETLMKNYKWALVSYETFSHTVRLERSLW